jgi:hypothetical protein
VSPQVREEACEAGWAKTQPYGPTLSRTEVGDVVDAAIPVIAQAAYKAGQEEAKARIAEAREVIVNEAKAAAHFRDQCDTQAAQELLNERVASYEWVLSLDALAAIDKEGETNE